MHRLLYYPNFEIQDINFLKFALLYIDEIRPIIPHNALESLGDSMKLILRDTQLINPYSPTYQDGYIASLATMHYLEEKHSFISRNVEFGRINSYILYSDKYTDHFERYCLDHGLGESCDVGMRMGRDVAYTYMSILAGIISKEIEIDMITDVKNYTDPILNYNSRAGKKEITLLKTIQKEIQCYVPTDFSKIPIEEFIRLRSDNKFERARKNFVKELNHALDAYDEDCDNIDLYNLTDCRNEILGLLKDSFVYCSVLLVGVHSFKNMYATEIGGLDFWGNAANAVVNLNELKMMYPEMKAYVDRIKGKKEARKYLADISRLGGGVI